MKFLRIFIFIFFFLSSFFLSFSVSYAVNGDYRLEKQAVVRLHCDFVNQGFTALGSGVLVSPEGYLLTNAHVVSNNGELAYCNGALIEDTNLYIPDVSFNLRVLYVNNDYDIALLKIDNSLDGQNLYLEKSYIKNPWDYLKLNFQVARGNSVWLIAYPAISQGSLNITEGNILYKDRMNGLNYLFSNAVAFQGDSGGAAVDKNDQLIGIITSIDLKTNESHILDIDILYKVRDLLIKEGKDDIVSIINNILILNNAYEETPDLYPDLQGRCMDNAISLGDGKCQCITGYLFYNNTCISYDKACKNWYGEHSVYAGQYSIDDSGQITIQCACENNYKFNDDRTACIAINNIVHQEIVNTHCNNELKNRLRGYLLLQVEDHGRIWYVDPRSTDTVEVRQDRVLDIFRKYALGISNENLAKLRFAEDFLSKTKDSDFDGYSDYEEVVNGYDPFAKNKKKIEDQELINRLKGYLLLQVEDHGRIWYVDPKTALTYEVRKDNVLDLFRSLALGINNSNLFSLCPISNN